MKLLFALFESERENTNSQSPTFLLGNVLVWGKLCSSHVDLGLPGLWVWWAAAVQLIPMQSLIAWPHCNMPARSPLTGDTGTPPGTGKLGLQ